MHIQFRIRILSSSLKRSAAYHIVRQCVVVFSAVVYQVTPFIVPAAIVVLGVIYFFFTIGLNLKLSISTKILPAATQANSKRTAMATVANS